MSSFDSLLHFPAMQALLLAAIGALAFWLRDVPGLVLSWVKRFFITTLTLDSRDEFLFAALVEYMDLHPALRQVNQFTARSVRQGSAHQSLEDDLRSGQTPRAYLSPGEGLHILRIDGRLVWVRREVQVAQSVFERISLSHFGRSSAFLTRFLQQAIDARANRESDALSVYIPNPFHGGDWMRARLGSRRPRCSRRDRPRRCSATCSASTGRASAMPSWASRGAGAICCMARPARERPRWSRRWRPSCGSMSAP